MTAADRDRWQARWRQRRHTCLEPEPFLVRHIRWLHAGTVLDVACGSGRNALFLARLGFATTGIDIAKIALVRLAACARAAGLPIATRCADLDAPEALEGLGPFDNLVVIRYSPTPAQWQRLLARLRPGGVLLLCSFAPEDHFRFGTRPEYCLWPEQLEPLLAGTRVLVHERFVQDGRPLVGWVRERA